MTFRESQEFYAIYDQLYTIRFMATIIVNKKIADFLGITLERIIQ